MALVKCTDCGREISYSAKACPHCGAKPPKKPAGRAAKLVVIVLGVVVVGGIVATQQAQQDEAARVAALPQAEREALALERDNQARRVALAMTAAGAIKKAAKNPDSIKFDTMNVNEKATVACAEYRGTNSFNAVVRQATVFVDGKGSSSDSAAWNKHCTKAMYDLTLAVR